MKMRLDNSGAVTGVGSVMIAAVTVTAAIAALCGSKLTAPANPAVLIDDGEVCHITTRADCIEDYIAEQSAKLHPFDIITYAGSNDNGEFEIIVERAPEVTITDGDSVKNVRALKGETVSDMLSRENIEIGVLDHVCPPAESVIDSSTEVSVTRAFPVTILADGGEVKTLAAGITVGELLFREGISLGANDELNCSADETVREGMTVTVNRVQFRERTKTETLPFETEYTDSPLIKIGETETLNEGSDGQITITITDKYVNGVLVSGEVTDSRITDPVNRVIARGTALNTPYSKREGNFTLENGIPAEYEYKLEGKVTAYTAPLGSGTYSGRPLVIGSVGVDPDVIPFGSELYIVSDDGSHVYGYAIASDTGDIKGSGVLCDAYMGTEYEDALWWQAQFCSVYVLSVGDNSISWK